LTNGVTVTAVFERMVLPKALNEKLLNRSDPSMQEIPPPEPNVLKYVLSVAVGHVVGVADREAAARDKSPAAIIKWFFMLVPP
jgi:hypothetical protein